MTNEPQPVGAGGKIAAIQEERRSLMSLSPDRAMNRILDADNPVALVRAIPEQDFHILVHDIGAADALPLLALASSRQWEYLVDTEIWTRDRLQTAHALQWAELFLRADPARAAAWLMEDQVELIQLVLYGRIQIFLREHDEDPATYPEGAFSHDNTIYVHIPETSTPGDPEKEHPEPSPEAIRELIDRMAAADHARYLKIMLEISRMIPAELEEEMYRVRTVRMAERGFVPFEEALGVYQHMPADRLAGVPEKTPHTDTAGQRWILPPALPAGSINPGSVFGNTLSHLSTAIPMEDIEVEFAALCNRIGVADDIPVQSRAHLEAIVNKAGGYLGIALEMLCGGPDAIDLGKAAALLRKHTLIDIFRVGYGRVLELKWQADRWLSESWFQTQGLALTFWGETWLGVLGGLLIKRPQYFDNYRTGVIYREFASVADVRETEKIMADIRAVDRLLAMCRIDPSPVARSNRLNYQNLLLTAWARHRLNLDAPVSPISSGELSAFFSWLWNGDALPHRIDDDRKSAFLKWLGDRAQTPVDSLADQYGSLLEALFKELEDEYAQVPLSEMSPRYVQMLLVAPRP